MKKLIAILILGLICIFTVSVFAENDTHDGTTISGTVPFCVSWTLNEDDVSPFTGYVNIYAYDDNYFIVEDFIQITDFDCNTKYKITATKGSWTLPSNYHSTDGAKKADGNDSDLLLMVDNITAGYTSAGMAALGSYASYTAITKAGSDILGGGAVGAGAGHGVENAAADVNAKILMDWSKDIVGAYSVTVTLTITEVTD